MDRKSTVQTRGSKSQPVVLPDIWNLEFNIIVTRFETTVLKLVDTMKLLIEIVFNDEKMTITPSRINVEELNPDSGLNISVKPDAFMKTLQKCGLPIIVYYNGALMGNGQITFPDAMFEGILDGTPTQTFFDSSDIKIRNKVNARVDVFYQLRIKCDTPVPK